MTPDELKALLLSANDDGADIANIYDKVISIYSSVFSDSNEYKTKNDELASKVANLSDTNMKLIDRIKYQDDNFTDDEDYEDSNEFPTINDLFNM